MTKPTWAQTEAAAEAAYETWIDPVRDLEMPWDKLPEDHKERLYEAQLAALTAAAEIGPASDPRPLPEPELPGGHTEYNDIIAATIECCAQWHDDQFQKTGRLFHKESAAAIRKLKDEP